MHNQAPPPPTPQNTHTKTKTKMGENIHPLPTQKWKRRNHGLQIIKLTLL